MDWKVGTHRNGFPVGIFAAGMPLCSSVLTHFRNSVPELRFHQKNKKIGICIPDMCFVDGIVVEFRQRTCKQGTWHGRRPLRGLEILVLMYFNYGTNLKFTPTIKC